MEKKVLIQIAVTVIVLVFMLEMFQISGAQRYLNQGGTGPTPVESPTPGGLLFGTAAANATVVSYPDGVIAVSGTGAGADANLSASLSALQREGKVSYFDASGQDSVSAVLAQGANISEIATGLALAFPSYSLSSKAQLSLPLGNLTFQTDAGNVTAPASARIFIYMEPLVPTNASFDVLVGAMVANGTASGFEVQVAEKSGVVPINATVAALSDSWRVNATYPWEARAVNATVLGANLKAKYPNSSVSYRANSYIQVTGLSAEQAALVQNLTYVTFAIGETFYVEDDFANRSRAEADITGIAANASIIFPESQLLANINSPDINESAVSGILGENATVRRVGTLELGRLVEIRGKEFIASPGMTVVGALPLNASIGDDVASVANVTVRGARLISAR